MQRRVWGKLSSTIIQNFPLLPDGTCCHGSGQAQGWHSGPLQVTAGLSRAVLSRRKIGRRTFGISTDTAWLKGDKYSYCPMTQLIGREAQCLLLVRCHAVHPKQAVHCIKSSIFTTAYFFRDERTMSWISMMSGCCSPVSRLLYEESKMLNNCLSQRRPKYFNILDKIVVL